MIAVVQGEIISSFANRDVDEKDGLLMGVRDAEPEEEAR